jgi:hypothetical protein
MAKMFYSLEEVQEKLRRPAEEIKQLVRDGKLREFRDGAKVMFKVDEVDKLAPSDLANMDTGEIKLAPGDSADRISLTPSDSGSQVGLVPGDSADQISLDDTGEAKTKDDTVITSHGLNVLDDSDSELAMVDPLAQTQIAPDLDDQVHLDSGSSGSGLLDLTREADDTSLGAELLDEIYPGAGDQGAIETQIPSGLDVAAEASSVMAMDAEAPVMADYTKFIEVYDPTSGPFGFMLIVPLLVLIYLACVAAAGVTGVRPLLLTDLSGIIWYVVGGAAVVAAVILLVGQLLIKKSGQPPRPKVKAKAKAKTPAASS